MPDESLTIDEGAVAPWNSLMWSLMTDVCREMGVRTDVPFKDLTEDVYKRQNVEMAEEVGKENMFIFGASADEIINLENNGGYNPMDIFNNDQDIRRVLMQLINGYYSPQDPERFRDIYKSLRNTQSSDRADTYFILKDFRSYAEAHRKIDQAYRDEKWWARTAMLNTASAGKFSSDRTICLLYTSLLADIRSGEDQLCVGYTVIFNEYDL